MVSKGKDFISVITDLLPLTSLSALLICLSFPKWNFGFLAWFALAPLLRAVEGLDFKKSFFHGWLSGTAAFCGILYWIIPTFQAAGVHFTVGILSLLLLAGYIGLYFGLFAGISETFLKSFPEPLYLLCSTALWTALEYVRGRFLTGFPWALLGYSQWNFVPAAQIAEWTGIYGVSAILIAANLTILTIVRKKRIHFSSLAVLFALLGVNFFLYFHSKLMPSKFGNGARIALLQGNIDQYKKWSPEYVQEILQSYQTLVEKIQSKIQSENSTVDLVIWPETAVPGWIPEEKWLMDWIEKTVQKVNSVHLIGAVTKSVGRNFNAAFLFNEKGRIASRYDKMHLVPFGEFVPLRSLLGRWIPVLNELGGFDSGKQSVLLQIPKSTLAVTICYEAIFPELVRKEVLKGAGLIVNITNDGWYLDTAAPEQHFSMNVFRAIENRKFLVRAANTGISGFIRPDGTILSKSRLNNRALLIEDVFANHHKTFYTKYGDVFAWGCCVISFLGIIFGIRNTKLEILKQTQNLKP